MNSPAPNPIPSVCFLPVPPARVVFVTLKALQGPVLTPSPTIHLRTPHFHVGCSECRSKKCFYGGKDREERSQKLGKLFCFPGTSTEFSSDCWQPVKLSIDELSSIMCVIIYWKYSLSCPVAGARFQLHLRLWSCICGHSSVSGEQRNSSDNFVFWLIFVFQ